MPPSDASMTVLRNASRDASMFALFNASRRRQPASSEASMLSGVRRARVNSNVALATAPGGRGGGGDVGGGGDGGDGGDGDGGSIEKEGIGVIGGAGKGGGGLVPPQTPSDSPGSPLDKTAMSADGDVATPGGASMLQTMTPPPLGRA